MPRASLVYLRDRKGRGGVGWSSLVRDMVEGGGEESSWSVEEREREREQGRDGGMDVR